jgi:hypothetical protein
MEPPLILGMTIVTIAYYRKLTRMCGVWATARHMAKLGYTVEQARFVCLKA